MVEVSSHSPSSGRNFWKVITVDGKVVYNATGGNCSKPDQGGEGAWDERPCLKPHRSIYSAELDGCVSCTSACAEVPRISTDTAGEQPAAADFVETLRFKLAGTGTIGNLSFALNAAVESSEAFTVLWNISAVGRSNDAGWKFHSGIDQLLSPLVAVHEAVVNATQTLLHCSC